MALDQASVHGSVSVDTPARNASSGAERKMRQNAYGEQVVSPLGKGLYSLADEGAYFVATNPTPGTAIAGIAAPG